MKKSKKNKKLLNWARGIDTDLLNAFYEVFGREPNSDDTIEVYDTELFHIMANNDVAFAIVSENGKVSKMSDFGYAGTVLWSKDENRLVEV